MTHWSKEGTEELVPKAGYGKSESVEITNLDVISRLKIKADKTAIEAIKAGETVEGAEIKSKSKFPQVGGMYVLEH